jgi:enoyl-CoA hydratase
MNPDPITIDASGDGVVKVEINRPEQRNALSLQALESLARAFETLRDEPGLKCALLTGAGDRCFAAGGDLKELASYRTRAQAAQVSHTGRRALDAIRDFPVPVYAALNGHALGGGAELALACDFRVARAGATLGFLQGKLNITTAWGGGADLLRILGPGRGLELLLSSRVMTAAEALQLGLIDQVVPDGEDLLAAVRTHAAQYLSKPSHVIRAFTQLAHAARSVYQTQMAPLELQSFVDTWVDETHWAAATAALTRPKATDGKA